jgi:hypothetical protein
MRRLVFSGAPPDSADASLAVGILSNPDIISLGLRGMDHAGALLDKAPNLQTEPIFWIGNG